MSIPSARLIRVLSRLIDCYGPPDAIRLDNGPEMISEAFTEWAAAKGISIRYIQPGKPNQNAFIERFNRTYRTEVLDAHLFANLEQVKQYGSMAGRLQRIPPARVAGWPPSGALHASVNPCSDRLSVSVYLTGVLTRFYSLCKLGAPLEQQYAPRIIRKYIAKFRSLGIDLNVPNATAETLQLGELFSAAGRIATAPEWVVAAGRAPCVRKRIDRAEQRLLHRLRRRARSTPSPTLDLDCILSRTIS